MTDIFTDIVIDLDEQDSHNYILFQVDKLVNELVSNISKVLYNFGARMKNLIMSQQIEAEDAINWMQKLHIYFSKIVEKSQAYTTDLQQSYNKDQNLIQVQEKQPTNLKEKILNKDNNTIIISDQTKKKAIIIPDEPIETEINYVRGVTKIDYNGIVFTCPICQKDSFIKLKYLASHMKTHHHLNYPNNYFCPHCLKQHTLAIKMAKHLFRVHGTTEHYQKFYQAPGCEMKFDVSKMRQLSTFVSECMAYHSFFNPKAQTTDQFIDS